MDRILLSPPVAMCFFLVLACGLYWLAGALAARGEEHPGKHLPYACGEDLAPLNVQLTYHGFLRLALMFGILHMATLVVSTLPPAAAPRRLATAYLIGIGISVLVLTGRED